MWSPSAWRACTYTASSPSSGNNKKKLPLGRATKGSFFFAFCSILRLEPAGVVFEIGAHGHEGHLPAADLIAPRALRRFPAQGDQRAILFHIGEDQLILPQQDADAAVLGLGVLPGDHRHAAVQQQHVIVVQGVHAQGKLFVPLPDGAVVL